MLVIAMDDRISSCNKNLKNVLTEINMAHIIVSLKRGWGEFVTLTTKCFASAVAQDHILSV